MMCSLQLRWLDHGDLLVMDGSAQSEYAHRTASALQGPRVNLAYRWVTQHAASFPFAGVVGCVFPTCVQGYVEPNSRGLGEGENKWSSSWGLVLLLSILVFAFWSAPGVTLGGGIVTVVSVHPARRRASPLGVVPVGLGDVVGDCHDVANLLKIVSFYFPFFLGEQTLLFFLEFGFLFLYTAGYASG